MRKISGELEPHLRLIFALSRPVFAGLVKSTLRIVGRFRNYHIPGIPFVLSCSPFVSYPLT